MQSFERLGQVEPKQARTIEPHRAIPMSRTTPLLPPLAGRFAVSAVLLSCASVAFAADGAPHAPSEVIFLGQLVVLMVVGRLLGEGVIRIGQPSIMGQL